MVFVKIPSAFFKSSFFVFIEGYLNFVIMKVK